MEPEVYHFSDTHFDHENIIAYEGRPFKNPSDMESIIRTNWNATVGKSDKVFFHGDFSLYQKKERVQTLLGRLHGRKILIMGNHDHSKSANWWRDAGFEEVYKYPILYDGFYILSHVPVYLGKTTPYVNIHGHIHSKMMTGGNYVNVSAEATDYKPVNFKDIKKMFDIHKEDKTE
jgi:calcineurin-like phosphoesterase family protein